MSLEYIIEKFREIPDNISVKTKTHYELMRTEIKRLDEELNKLSINNIDFMVKDYFRQICIYKLIEYENKIFQGETEK